MREQRGAPREYGEQYGAVQSAVDGSLKWLSWSRLKLSSCAIIKVSPARSAEIYFPAENASSQQNHE